MPRKRPFNSNFSQNRTADDFHLNFSSNDTEHDEPPSKYIPIGFAKENINRILLTHIVTAVYGLLIIHTILRNEHYSNIGNLYFLPVLVIHILLEYFKYSLFHIQTTNSSLKNSKNYILRFLSTFFFAVVICYVFAVIFGADFLENIEGTFMFSCVVTTLAVVPLYFEAGANCLLLIFFQRQATRFPQKITLTASHCVIIGAWIGAFVIPLDWNRPWQIWPIPCVIGALIGYTLGELIGCGKILVFRYDI